MSLSRHIAREEVLGEGYAERTTSDDDNIERLIRSASSRFI
jgi:hypothetical protein